ncbi:MAG TPA: adenylate/guanylate cyclase domain-containing protein [Gaiellaceae bacterium]|nr:adenylate/guanylate cyclase domain-containing protein [Gaiellaceae bacterium]
MTRALPTGVVTFLFTDVEGSTKLLHELGDAYADALHEHRRLLREVFAAHEGVEVDTQGDAFFVAFGRASKAVAAAAGAQRALERGPIRVRMGLHTGEPRVTEEGYVGLDVHKGARIAAVGYGGQVLLSQATRTLVEADVRDLGPHRLKDLSAPERIFQLEIEGLPSEFPPLKTLEAGMRNLPAPRTSFVGRADELESIDHMLDDPDCRLLTLVGPGGVGKTRLALEAAARRIDRYQHGVHFVPLVGVPAPDLLAPAVAESLQFQVDSAHSAIPARDQLVDFLRERATLLVLDNFEHLLDGRDLLTEVIEQAPQVELMTTSRERLQVQSEWVLDLDGLGVQNGNGHSGESPAVRLFVERARQADAGFAPDDDERADIGRVCGLVRGMPLGIELAAAWVSMLPCAEIADEIERNLGFLETSMRDIPERHRSLRAAFDQSWRLLSDDERRMFSRLAVFRGSFTRDAASAVAGAGLSELHGLVNKSLVRRAEIGRFELHELLRQFAGERLAAEQAELADARESHARFYLGMVAEQAEELLAEDMMEARDELRLEVDNLRAAAEWAVTQWSEGDVRAVLSSLQVFFWAHSWYEGSQTFAQLADLLEPSPAGPLDVGKASDVLLSALAYQTYLGSALGYDEKLDAIARACLPMLRERQLTRELGVCLLALGTNDCYRDVYPESAANLEEAIDVARSVGDHLVVAASLSWLGFVRLLLDDLGGAREAFEECHAVSAELGGPLMLGFAVSKLGLLADAEDDYAKAIDLHLEARDLFAGLGDQGGAGYTLSRASMSAYCLGDFEQAMQHALAGYEGFEQANHRWGMTAALCRLGFAAGALGRFDEARNHLRGALELAREMQASSLLLHALSGVGVLLVREGERQRGAEVLLFALGHEAMPATYRQVALPVLEQLERELSPDELAAAREAAAETGLDALVSEELGERVR